MPSRHANKRAGIPRWIAAIARRFPTLQRGQSLDYLRRLKRELRLFTVLATHHADEVGALADEVLRLSAGRVVRQGPIAQFIARRVGSAAPLHPAWG